ncbi:MAG: beta-ketoacyl synthase N-terminal-like domain-containing protein, partial [Isosphaeraceae bacterium]
MSSTPSRVVITGLGISCPMATGQADLIDSLREGRNGIGPISSFAVPNEVTSAVGEIR